jgi:ABC-type Fe3+/spermidine/putrescine transport system ATPase subunit
MMGSRSPSETPLRGETLALVDVRKRYGDFTAVDGVSLEVPAGALLTLLGPSGCGKSTLLRLIAGFVTASEGRVTLGGRDVLSIPPYQRETAMVFQSYALFPHMTIVENVMFGLKMRKVPQADAKKRAMDALDMVKLTHLAGRHPSQLSGGQQQRAALARALVTNPRVLLLDEPFGALDKSLREEMQVELRKLQLAVGVTTVCVTHDQQEAMTISDRIAVMRDGRIEQCGTPVEIYDQPQTRFVASFIGTSNNLAGEVTAHQGKLAALRLENGAMLSIPGDATTTVEAHIEIAVRPSAVRLRAPGYRGAMHANDHDHSEADGEREGDGNTAVQSPVMAISIQSLSHFSGTVAFATNLGDRVNYDIVIGDTIHLTVDAQRHAGERTFAAGDAVDVLIDAKDCRVLMR